VPDVAVGVQAAAEAAEGANRATAPMKPSRAANRAGLAPARCSDRGCASVREVPTGSLLVATPLSGESTDRD
jgi:hypothetical protein